MSSSRPSDHPDIRRRRLEMLIFVAVSGVGVYAMGSGLRAVTEPGQGASLLWLAIAGAAMWILFSQMGRVHDSWPQRRRAKTLQGTPAAASPNRGGVPAAKSGHDCEEDS